MAVRGYAQAPSQTADTYIRPYTEGFQYGTNLGHYGSVWSDDALAGAAQTLGVHSVRPTLPEYFVAQYGYSIRTSTFAAYVNQLGMRELTCFIEGPSTAHRDWTTYPGGTGPSKLFAHLYEPIWNNDGSVNANNYYAYYLYQLLQLYGDKVRFWEVVNEPDFTYGASQGDWLKRAPSPGELQNLQAPIYHYIRMLRISYEVVKKYHPEAYVTTGGVGYSEFVDALMRYTDNPVDGKPTAQYPRTGGAYIDVLSYHTYPSYALHFWDNSIGGFRYTRTSDYAVAKLLNDKKAMEDVLGRYGYNGTTHPAKYLIVTETNVSRRTSDDRVSSDEMQRNYGIKTLVMAQKAGIQQLYLYNLGEAVNAPWAGSSVSGTDELGLMGLYENLNRDKPGQQKVTPLGRGVATTSSLLYGATYDAARSAQLVLPSNVEGAAFRRNGGYSYVLWAKALTDKSEQASATYSFPASWKLSSIKRYEWDYTATKNSTTQSSQGITLGGTPSFFEESGSVATVPSPSVPPSGGGCAGTGGLTREQWNNVWGTGVEAIPVNSAASSTSRLAGFEFSSENAYNYGTRVRGYLCVPQTGRYTFWLAGDDAAELWLSPDQTPAGKVRVASSSGWTSGPYDWDRSAGQRSGAVSLVAGQRYYVEALHKQNWGGAYLAVAWQREGGARELIPASSLIPFVADPVTTSPVATPPPTTIAPPTTTTKKASIVVTFTGAVSSATTTSTIAPTLYNKSRVLQFEEDDSPVSIFTEVYPLLNGGKASNGKTYPGLRFTDGCGNNRSYTAAVAVNGHNPYDNTIWMNEGDGHDASKLTWTQAQTLLDQGWDVENHSDLHTAANPWQQVATLDALITSRLKGYKASVFIVPSNYGGFVSAAFNNGYRAVSSNSQSDNLPMLNRYTDDRIALSSLPTVTTPFVYNRYNADQVSGEAGWFYLNRLKKVSDDLMRGSTSEVYLQRVFTHGMNFDVLADWMNYTQSIAKDQVWVTTLRDFTDYRYTSSQVEKKETVSGNTLTIELDYSTVNSATLLQHLTLSVNSPVGIKSIVVAGADSSSSNIYTKLVNVFRGQAVATVTPVPSPSVPPSGGGCAGTGGLTREQWNNVWGTGVEAIPVNSAASSTSRLAGFEFSSENAYNYGTRVRGYLCVPQTGRYTFWLAGDDAAELWLSPDQTPAGKVRVASSSGWTSGPYDWDRSAGQRSGAVSLVAGQRYYVEALHKQNWGGAYLAVAWQREGGARELIPASSLIPFESSTGSLSAIGTADAHALDAATPVAAATTPSLSIYPNPFQREATITFSVPGNGPLSLELYSTQGQRIQSLLTDRAAGGTAQTYQLHLAGVPAGLYILRLTTDQAVITQKIVYNSN